MQINSLLKHELYNSKTWSNINLHKLYIKQETNKIPNNIQNGSQREKRIYLKRKTQFKDTYIQSMGITEEGV